MNGGGILYEFRLFALFLVKTDQVRKIGSLVKCSLEKCSQPFFSAFVTNQVTVRLQYQNSGGSITNSET